MRPIPDSWSVVVLGRWNVSILNPGWLGKHVFETPEVQVEFSLSPGAPPRFTSGGVRIIPQQGVLTVVPATLTEDAMQRAESAAARILDLLQHTPITGVGVNFAFEEPTPDEALLGKFPDACEASFSDQAFQIQEHSYSWRLQKEGQVTNVGVTIKPGSAQFEFNFHTDAADTQSAKAAVSGRALAHLKAARELLEETFDLSEDT